MWELGCLGVVIEQEPRKFIYVKRATCMDSIFWCSLPPLSLKSVAGVSGVWLCIRNPLISAAITEKPIIVNICTSVHAITISKVSIPMFSWSEISFFVFKSV